MSEGEKAQARVNELCAKLRQMTLPPIRMDQSPEAIERWRSIRD